MYMHSMYVMYNFKCTYMSLILYTMMHLYKNSYVINNSHINHFYCVLKSKFRKKSKFSEKKQHFYRLIPIFLINSTFPEFMNILTLNELQKN